MTGPISRAIDRLFGDAPSADAELIAKALRRNAIPMKYEVRNESDQVIAMTATLWTAERLIEGIEANGKLPGSWTITQV